MDEEDGRLGPLRGHIIGKVSASLMDVTGSRAQHDGRADVLWDALTMSLCLPPKHSSLKTHQMPRVSPLRRGRELQLPKHQAQKRGRP